jgi:hypothetical protein
VELGDLGLGSHVELGDLSLGSHSELGDLGLGSHSDLDYIPETDTETVEVSAA